MLNVGIQTLRFVKIIHYAKSIRKKSDAFVSYNIMKQKDQYVPVEKFKRLRILKIF